MCLKCFSLHILHTVSDLFPCLEKHSALWALSQSAWMSSKTTKLGTWCGKNLHWSSGGWSRHTGIDTYLTQESSHTRAQEHGI